jgi:homoserine kinase
MFCSVMAPASSANLGPGFDCLAIALDRWTRVDARLDGGDNIVDAGSPDLMGGANLVIEAMEVTAKSLGFRLPGCEVRVTSDIPIARGLGSSAAAIVAGVRLAGLIAGNGPLADDVVIDIAGTMEGHADNASASVLGGITVSVPVSGGFVTEVLTPWIPWSPVLFVPDLAAFTSDARAVLPADIPVHDVVANISRGALLAVALRDRREDLLAVAMQDRLHQPYRASIFPHLEPVIEAALAAGAAGASLSGAGPTVLAFARPDEEERVGLAMAAAAHACGVHGGHHTIRMASRGCYVL